MAPGSTSAIEEYRVLDEDWSLISWSDENQSKEEVTGEGIEENEGED